MAQQRCKYYTSYTTQKHRQCLSTKQAAQTFPEELTSTPSFVRDLRERIIIPTTRLPTILGITSDVYVKHMSTEHFFALWSQSQDDMNHWYEIFTSTGSYFGKADVHLQKKIEFRCPIQTKMDKAGRQLLYTDIKHTQP